MSDDLVTELRLIGCHSNGDARCTCGIGQEAADEITALRARLDAVEKSNLTHKEWWIEADTRAERAEAALATARRDACGRAAMVAEAWIARKENLISLPDAIRALTAQEEAAQDRGMEGRVNPPMSDVSIVSGDKTST